MRGEMLNEKVGTKKFAVVLTCEMWCSLLAAFFFLEF